MRHTQIQPIAGGERGSALLLSLGILSLVLLLAMSFAYSSNTRLSIAKSQGGTTGTRAMADQAVQLVMSDLVHLFEKTEKTGVDQTVSLYPPATMASDETGDVSGDGAFNQNLLLFQRFNPSGTSSTASAYQMYAVSHNNEETATQEDRGYVGYQLGLASRGDWQDSKDDYAYTWLSYTGSSDMDKTLRKGLAFLPQLAPMVSQLQNGLSFMPPLTMQYSISDGDTSSTMDKVVGRYAYVLLDETGRLGINQLLNLTGEPPAAMDHLSASASTDANGSAMLGGGQYCDRLAPVEELAVTLNADDAYFGFNIYGDTIPSTIDENTATIRLGLVPQEIAVSDKDYRTKLEFVNGVSSGWQSYSHLCDEMGDTFCKAQPTGDADVADVFAYTPYAMQDIEAWWNEDDKKEMARFDLTGASWGMSGSGDDRLLRQVNTGDLTLNPAKTGWAVPTTGASAFTQAESEELVLRLAGYKSTSKPSDRTTAAAPDLDGQLEFWDDRAKGLPNYSVEKTLNNNSCVGYLNWLQYMVDDDGNSVTLDVAANIKDYSDTDSYASTDFNPAATAEDDLFKEPLFCGNEKVAYLNEVALKSDFARDGDGNYNVRIYAAVELLNLYCNPEDCNASECTVPAGHVKVKYTGKLKVFKQTFKYVQKSTGGEGGGSSGGSTGGGDGGGSSGGNTGGGDGGGSNGGSTGGQTGGLNAGETGFAQLEENAEGRATPASSKVLYSVDFASMKNGYTFLQASGAGDGAGDDTTAGEWQPAPSAEGGDITELGTYDMSGIQEFSSSSDGWYGVSEEELPANEKKTALQNAHLGYNTIYMRKVLNWKKLQELCPSMPAAAMQAEIEKPVKDKDEVVGTTKTIYAFYVVFDKCVAYTYGDDADETKSLYDVACLELDGGKDYCVDTSTQNTAYFAEFIPDNINAAHVPGSFKDIDITVDFESKDSRCNHRNAGGKFWTVNQWQASTGGSGAMTAPAQTLNKDNTDGFTSNASATASVDMEHDVKFPNASDTLASAKGNRTYSTAYIRNEPMRSLWELGAIHRGYPNQTINLKQYTEKADWATTDKVTYAEGDAGMLDQVKIGPLLFVEGKVNANMRNPLIWEDLLGGIAYGWYEPSVTSFTVFDQDSTGASPTYTELYNGGAWSGLARPTSYSRGAVARMLQQVLTAKNDRDWEATIGKTAQLLTTRCELYSLLLYAESLDDVTDAVSEAIANGVTLKDLLPTNGELRKVRAKMPGDSSYTDRYCKVMGRQKVLLQLVRDAWQKELKVVGKRYLEE
ncbi:MAG: hypothetical protein ACI4WT_06370 [Oligosphaeraceae bacterium]